MLAIAVFVGAAIWNAAHDDGLVIEAFQVPPDMTARGLTGQTVASQLLDKLSRSRRRRTRPRTATSYTNNWGDDIKVEIPNTGNLHWRVQALSRRLARARDAYQRRGLPRRHRRDGDRARRRR
ncbi:MAG: hypothetical protein WDM89_18495 [Rhizomicrobium sp.]